VSAYYLREPLTASDKRRAKPVIVRWQSDLYARQDPAEWSRIFARLEPVFVKTRPKGPVVIYRGARSADEIGDTRYDRFTSWSLDPHHGFKFERGAPDVMAYVHPESIVGSLSAFGNIDRDQLSEVILRPGRYTVVKQAYDVRPPLSPAPSIAGQAAGDTRRAPNTAPSNLDGLGVILFEDRYQGRIAGVRATLIKTETLAADARHNRDSGNDREGGMYAALESSIVGQIQVGEIEPERGDCLGSWQVGTVAGPGYGEILYGIGFGVSPKGLLTADRMNVSQAALRVWERQTGRRRHPFEALSRRDAASCTRYPKHPALNYAYEAEGWEKPMVKRLKLAGLTATSRARAILRVDARDFADIVSEVSENFWSRHRPSSFHLSSLTE
jgi:hypothetical protein